jgi:hypothetical protein
MLRGAIHIHSTYSDGELTLSELKDVYQAAGCSFLAMTDHAEAFGAEQLERYVAECRALSDETFTFVAGLEFACLNRMHVLGLGVTTLATSREPQEVFAHIERKDGISVIAHPLDTAFPWIESFQKLPSGIEVWNSKYDGRYAPRVATFDLLSRLKQKRPDLRAFFGQDLHWRRQFKGLFVETNLSRPDAGALLAALARGDYVARKGLRLQLPSTGELSAAQRSRFIESHWRSERIRGLVKTARGFASRFGMPVPPGVKAQLRRIF